MVEYVLAPNQERVLMLNDAAKILVVDDEKRMCASLQTLISRVGCDVTTANEGEEAIKKIEKDDFDLVITDIKMPRVDGLDVLKAARKKDEDAVVILMTGYASLESAISAINQGAYDYLMKPIEFPELKLSIQRALEKRRLDKDKVKLLTELQQKNLELKKKVAELNALYKAGMSLSTTQNLKNLLNKIVSLATGVIEAKSGSIMLIQKPENVLTIEAAIGLSPNIVKHTRMELGSSIAGYVAQRGKALIVEDIEKDSRFRQLSKKHYATRSLLCVPLRIKDNVLGVINLSDKKTGTAFNQNDLRLLTTFASQAAIAIDDAEHFNESLKKIGELEVLYEIASQLSSLESLGGVCSFIFDRIKTIMPVEFALWFEWNEKAEELVLNLLHGCGDSKSNVVVSLTKRDISDPKKVNGKIKKSLMQDSDLSPHLNTLVSFPIIAEKSIHGVLSVGNRRKERLSDEQRRFVSIIVSQSASVYEKKKSLLNATRLITMGNLVSEITHDLKKPLTNIRGTLQLLREKYSDAKNKEKYFNLVEEEIFRLDGLVKEIVNFSNPYKYETEKKNIASVLDRALKLVERDLKSRNISLEKEYEEGHTVLVDKNQMMEVFLNIILNSIEAMPHGGELKVSTTAHQHEKTGGELIQICVSDTGCGIPDENLNCIFDRYFTTKKEGTGLGLAVVERIVKAHGGSVSVESQPGKGTRFFVNLPAA
jgi:signal transduction histidine kinase/DNA-binding response OmpR family regulator